MADHAMAEGGSIRIRFGAGAEATTMAIQSQPVSSKVEMVVIFDTTGSMDSFIAPMTNCVSELAAGLKSGGVEWEATVVPFGDLLIAGDTIDIGQPWVTTCPQINGQLAGMQRNMGGGNGGESSLEAIELGLARLREQPVAPRVIILITDDAPHTHDRSPGDIVTQLVATDAVAFVISPDMPAYRDFAQVTGGEWLNIYGSIDPTALALQIKNLGSKIATRVQKVLEAGGSAQGLLALEKGGESP